MKRFIPPILLGGLIIALFVALQGGTAGLAGDKTSLQAEKPILNQAAPLTWPIWECIAIVHGDVQNEAVVLETANFGFDYVVVQKPEFFCEAALKLTTSQPSQTAIDDRILVCFSIRRGQDPDDPVTLDTANFGSDDVQVRRSTIMCEEGTKARVDPQCCNDEGEPTVDKDDPTFGEPFGELTGTVWQCFTLEQGTNPNVRRWLQTDNFGVDDVTIVQSGLMCEPAVKYLDDGVVTPGGQFPEENVLQCFRILGGVKVEEEFLLLETDNFGDDRVQMRNGSMMCEIAEKESFITDFEITLPTVAPSN